MAVRVAIDVKVGRVGVGEVSARRCHARVGGQHRAWRGAGGGDRFPPGGRGGNAQLVLLRTTSRLRSVWRSTFSVTEP